MLREVKATNNKEVHVGHRMQQVPSKRSRTVSPRFSQLGTAAFSSTLHEGWYTSEFLRTPPVSSVVVDVSDTTPYNTLAHEALAAAALEAQKDVDQKQAAMQAENQSARAHTLQRDVLRMLRSSLKENNSLRNMAESEVKPTPSTSYADEHHDRNRENQKLDEKKFMSFKLSLTEGGSPVSCK